MSDTTESSLPLCSILNILTSPSPSEMQKRKKLTRLVTCEVLLAAGRSHPLDVLPLRIVELLHLDVVLVPLPLPCELQLYPDRVLTIPSVLSWM